MAVKAKKGPGYFADGDGLYLQVTKAGSKSWILRYMLSGRPREMGLGSLTDWTLAEAREAARKARQLLAAGIDPIEAREKERVHARQEAAQMRTFEQCAQEYHRTHKGTWKNAKHADQWINTLTSYAFPVFGDRDVSLIGKADILKVLEPIWTAKTETATRVRQRIKAVLDWAAARDYRKGHDPHLWDQVTRALPNSKDLKKATHFEACPYSEAYSALQSINDSTAGEMVKLALAFTVLTAARSGEVRGARWCEIDWQEKRWVIPAERMKAGREHRVPLSTAALKILEWLDARRTPQEREQAKDGLIFPSDKGKPLSDMTLTMLLRRLNHTFTVHGFRSTFRDWAAEKTAFPREVCEAALAHVSGKDATEAAYFRSDLFEKRRQLMEAWGIYCCTAPTHATVAEIRSAAAA